MVAIQRAIKKGETPVSGPVDLQGNPISGLFALLRFPSFSPELLLFLKNNIPFYPSFLLFTCTILDIHPF